MAKRKRSSSRKKSNPPNIWVVLLILLVIGVAYLVQQGYINPDQYGLGWLFSEEERTDIVSVPKPTVTGNGEVQVFFTTPYLVYPDDRERRTPMPHEQAMIADIDAAQQSVDMAVFEYDLESLAQALVRAEQRGVTVRLALDEEHLEEDEEMAYWAGEVEQAGIPIAWEPSTAFLHSKYIIIDDQIVWMGSWNASNNDTYRNNNNLIRFTIPPIVENYNVEFEQMFNDTFGNDKQAMTPNPVVTVGDMRIENYFQPREKVAPLIVERIAGAQQSVRFLAFSYTSDPIGEAMLERHDVGIEVRGVFEKRNAEGLGSEYPALLDAGVDVLRDGNCYTMHHKFIVIDERTVITGSYNFSDRAENTNDENLVIIDSPAIAAQYLEEFERVYEQAVAQPPCGG
ncbi:MAG: DUF1669 domain-containing protein [Chloroflexaceae bacterium]|nr:DUF1669 domain-containing protein [Chloroflexaceae bacterium]